MLRTDAKDFEFVLNQISHLIGGYDERLVLTLRYMATGESFQLFFTFFE